MKNIPTILAIETASSACSVALSVGGQQFYQEQIGNNIHSQVLLSMIQQVLQEADITAQELSAIAVGQGPGSFTGLRIGIGVAQGLAFAVNCPMIGLGSLQALANQYQGDGVIVAALDARMAELYWAVYEKRQGVLHMLQEPQVSAPDEITLSLITGLAEKNDSTEKIEIVGVGNAWGEYAQKFNADLLASLVIESGIIYPKAAGLLALAQTQFEQKNFISASDFAPLYVRNDVAKKSTKPLL